MKQLRKRRGLAIVVSLAMAITMMPVFVMTAYAAAGDPAMVEGTDVLQSTSNTKDAQTVYMADKAWRVIGYGGEGVASATNTMTLLSAGILKTDVVFREYIRDEGSDSWYHQSILQSEVEAIANTFSAGEKAGIATRKLRAGDYNGYDTDTVSRYSVDNALLWPLSTKEAHYTLNGDIRNVHDFWWLRSPGYTSPPFFTCHISYVKSDGNVDEEGCLVTEKNGVRPAFNYKLNSVIFSSAATGGKVSGTIGADSLMTVGSNDSGEWKLTLLDDGTIYGFNSHLNGHEGFTASRADSGNVVAGGKIKIKYNGGRTGTNEYVSVFLKDSTGKIVYYGHLAENSESATGAALTIPSDIALGTYTVGVFAEQCNGDNKTDYGSAISTFDITVVNHSHELTYSADGPTITATCANTDGNCPLTDCKATLTITKPLHDTYGDGKSAEAGITDENSIQGDAKVKYQKKTGESSYDTETETAPTDARTYKASITVGDTTASVEYTIAKADITPEVNIEDWDYGDTPNDPSVTSAGNPGGGEVTYKYYTDEECAKETTSAQGASEEGSVPSYGGDYWVKATVEETDNYKSGTGIKKFTINTAAITVTGLKGDSKVYDGTTSATLGVSDATLVGVKSGDEVRIASATGTFNDKNIGTDKTISSITIVLEGKDAGGYKAAVDSATVTGAITAKEVKVSGIAASDKTYDGNTTAILTFTGALFDGMIDGDDLSVKGKDSQDGTFDNMNVGSGKTVTLPALALDGNDSANYTISDDSQTAASAAITAKELSVTADNKSKTYGEDDPEFTYTSDGLITGDTFTGALERAKGDDVGTYDINQGTLSAGDNYTIKYTKGTFTINKAATNSVTASIEGWIYGDDPNKPNATATHGQETAIFTYSDAADGTYTETVPTGAGTWYVKATVYETDNYVGAVSEPVEFTIAKKEVGLEWSDTELTYNGEDQKPKATATGLVGQDECTVTVSGEKTDSNAKSGETSYTATAESLSNDNYKLPDNTTTEFTIVPKKLTQAMISLNSDTFKHDGTEKSPAVSMTDSDILEDDAPKQMKVDEDYTLSGDLSSSDLGTHFITAKGEGNYTGSIDTSWMIYNNKSGEDKEEGTSGKGDFEVFVDIESNTSTLTVDNFNISMAKGFLTQEDMTRYNKGENILVYMIIKEQLESEVEPTDSSLLGGLFRTEGAMDISWYDITVWKKIGSSAATKVHDTKDELSMGVEVPDKYKDAPEGYTREFYLGRAHDGMASLLANTSEVKVGFSSDKFSTYALAYKDTEIPEPDKDKPDNPDDSDDKGSSNGNGSGKGSSSSKAAAKTGDSNDIAGLLALMLASGGVLGVIGHRRRRETDK